MKYILSVAIIQTNLDIFWQDTGRQEKKKGSVRSCTNKVGFVARQIKEKINMYNPGQEISSLDFGAIIGGSLNAVVKAQSQSAQTTVDFIKNVGFQKKIETDEKGNTFETDVPINVAFSYDKEVSPSQVLAQQSYSVVIDEKNKGAGYKESDVKNYELKAGGIELPLESIELNGEGLKKVTLGKVPENISLEDGTALTLTYTGTQKPTKEAKLTLKVTTSYLNVPAVTQKMQIQVPILTMMPIPFIKIDNADIDFNVKINSVSTTSTDQKSETKGSASVRSNWFVKADLSASFSNQKSSTSTEEVKKDYSLNIKVHAAQDDMPAGVSRILDMLEETIKAQPVGVPQQPDTTPDKAPKELPK